LPATAAGAGQFQGVYSFAVIPEANFPEIFDFAGKLSCPESISHK